MKNNPRIITDNNTLRAQYEELAAGDIVVGRIRLKPTEEYLLLDLVERGVKLFPAAVAQLASRSKAMQVRLFGGMMLPRTREVHDLHDLLAVMNEYGETGIGKVVTKLDRRNAGLGIFLWSSIEDVYSQAALGVLPFPLVIQPYISDCVDIRVIILGDYVESYIRDNPNNFRNNLHFGGVSRPHRLTADQLDLCQAAMRRGKFPYAHIDLMVTAEEGKTYLAEINLRGGARGAAIDPAAYGEKIDQINRSGLQQLLAATASARHDRLEL